jgi:hypothetical protein
MISSVQDYPVSTYFGVDNAQRFFIPKYQREYVWGRENWDSLFNDLRDSPEGHFLGSIICVNNQKDSMAGSRLELIDGQQRFTTITLLFCALYQRLKDNPEPDDDLTLELANLRKRIFVKPTDGAKAASAWRFEPSEQGNNKADFQRVLNQVFPKLAPAPQGLTHYGNRRIAKAFAFFREQLQRLSVEQSLEVLDKLKAAVLVKIEVPSHSDAFVLFETINNRGIPLSAIDIIKNNLLAQLDRHRNYGIDRAFDEWRDLIDLLPDPTIQERYLRQLYNTFRYLRRVDVRGHARATKSNLIKIYDELTERNPKLLFRELQARGRVYAALLDREAAEQKWGAATADGLADLHRLGAAPVYGFLLWVHHVASARRWDEAPLLATLANFLTKWFFWRNLTDVPATRDLDPLFADLVNSLVKKLRDSEIENAGTFAAGAETVLRIRAPSRQQCEEKLKGDLYIENYDATRFLLCKIEESHQTAESKRDLWALNAHGKPIFTVEHILPKTEKLGVEWVKMLQSDVETADTVRQRCAHQIGNLTLSGYNSSLGKMSFDRKRDRVNENGDFIGYRNGLYLNSTLEDRTDWNEVAIVDRSTSMRSEAMAILGMWPSA